MTTTEASYPIMKSSKVFKVKSVFNHDHMSIYPYGYDDHTRMVQILIWSGTYI